ncbi:MAG TPA: phosphatidylglycerophosphatase A [Terracidiphilus sp.]|nr:phosphatidylglycerophosphatase A [Terracidiphilus sp.]
MESQKKTAWAFAVATFFGAGRLKPGPGTWGSVGAVLVWAAFAWLVHPTPHVLLAALLVGIALSLIFGVPAATIAARESGKHDPGFVVIDEVAGQWITLLFCPPDWAHALVALVLFRLFDITKPFPVRSLERLPDGWGIVFDDVAAGLYALGIASLVRLWY